jgi:hypothetical protein
MQGPFLRSVALVQFYTWFSAEIMNRSPFSAVGTFETCRHVRSSVAIGGITDIAWAAHFGSD